MLMLVAGGFGWRAPTVLASASGQRCVAIADMDWRHAWGGGCTALLRPILTWPEIPEAKARMAEKSVPRLGWPLLAWLGWARSLHAFSDAFSLRLACLARLSGITKIIILFVSRGDQMILDNVQA